MILYNFIHRGAYEYDKFILNVLQFYNEVKRLKENLFTEASTGDSFLKTIEEVDHSYEAATGENSLSHQAYIKKLVIE